jgi:ATP-dependent Clp protease ATP-binding subunit ClpA
VAAWSSITLFEVFTDEAISVLMHAQEEALQFKSDFLEPEHVLLGLLKKADKAKIVCSRLGFNYGDVCRALESVIGPRSESPEKGCHPLGGRLVLVSHPDGEDLNQYAVPFSRSGKLTLLMACDLAEQNRNNRVGPEHLLLAVIKQNTTATNQILGRLGIEISSLEAATIEILDPPCDDFAEVFNRARASDVECLKISIQASRSKFDEATKHERHEVAQEALKNLNELEWMLSCYNSPTE